MRLAILDIGTNSLRFDLYRIENSRTICLIHREKHRVELGEDLYKSGFLSSKAIDRTVKVLEQISTGPLLRQADRVVSLGTSALRDAKNRELFLKKTARYSGVNVKVISGKEEAELILRGILLEESAVDNSLGFIDIGGGSTEIGFACRGKIKSLASFQLGSLRLAEIFGKKENSLTFGAPVSALKDHIDKELTSQKLQIPKDNFQFFGSSGTICCINSILKKSGRLRDGKIRRKHVRELSEELGILKLNEIAKVPGVTKSRINQILPGTVLLEQIMTRLDIKELKYSKYSLRDGILIRELENAAALQSKQKRIAA